MVESAQTAKIADPGHHLQSALGNQIISTRFRYYIEYVLGRATVRYIIVRYIDIDL